MLSDRATLVKEAHTGAAKPRYRCGVIREQSIQSIDEVQHGLVVTLSCSFITTKHWKITRILVRIECLLDDLCEHRRVGETKIGALTCQRMNGMGRIADKGQSGQHIFVCVLCAQWKCAART